MPIQSRYSNEEFETLTEQLFTVLEEQKSSRDLSIMVLGNVLSNIFSQQVNEGSREEMLEQFCAVLKKSVGKNTAAKSTH